jgi:hypothetical protein
MDIFQNFEKKSKIFSVELHTCGAKITRGFATCDFWAPHYTTSG